MCKPISVSLLPNTFFSDILKALSLLFSPRRWSQGKAILKLEKEFEKLFPQTKALSFLSGRTALLAILNSLKVGEGDEVLLQSFTCVVVPNAILKTGAKPVYVDIGEDFNLDLQDLEKKITPQSKAIIVQHTFGYPAAYSRIQKIAQKHQLKVIEDCAHGIGLRGVGDWGEAAFFSFGRDKAISSVFGGLVITQDKALFARLQNFRHPLPYPGKFFICRQLLYLPLFSLCLSLYNFLSLGKILLVFFQKTKIFLKAVFEKEKRGVFPPFLIAKLPNSLAELALFQLKRLKKFNQRRQKIVAFYAQELQSLPLKLPPYQLQGETLPLLRFTIQTPQAEKLYQFAKKRGVLFNNWYYPPLSPPGTDSQAVGYRPQNCPRAEKIAPQVVNLPTHPQMDLQKAQKVVQIIKDFYDYQAS